MCSAAGTAASRMRLKQNRYKCFVSELDRGGNCGISDEIETSNDAWRHLPAFACGGNCGISDEIETIRAVLAGQRIHGGGNCGISGEIETMIRWQSRHHSDAAAGTAASRMRLKPYQRWPGIPGRCWRRELRHLG